MESTRGGALGEAVLTVLLIQRLRAAAATLQAERVPIRVLLDAHGSATHGTLLILLAVPCLLPMPGLGSIFGLGVAALAIQMFVSPADVRLPARVASLELPRPFAQRVLRMLATLYALGGRWMKARLHHLTSGAYRWLIATTSGLMALLIVLPIPFGNVPPAVAIIVLGFGLVFRDGVMLLAGFAVAAIATLFDLAVVIAVWHFSAVWVVNGIQEFLHLD